MTLLSFFQTKQFRAFRATLFACLGLWGIAPAMHALWLHGGHPEVRTYFLLDMCMGAVYLVRRSRAPTASIVHCVSQALMQH